MVFVTMSYWTLVSSQGSTAQSKYWFVNETQVRLGAWIMVTIWLIIFLTTALTKQYIIGLVGVSVFWLDFLLKVINPHYSLFGILAWWWVKKKEVVRVGAIQKRFAWTMWLVMASIVLGLFLFHIISAKQGAITPVVPILCITCLVLMRCEAHLGLCVGCKIFAWLLKKEYITNPDAQTCPDWSCSLRP